MVTVNVLTASRFESSLIRSEFRAKEAMDAEVAKENAVNPRTDDIKA